MAADKVSMCWLREGGGACAARYSGRHRWQGGTVSQWQAGRQHTAVSCRGERHSRTAGQQDTRTPGPGQGANRTPAGDHHEKPQEDRQHRRVSFSSYNTNTRLNKIFHVIEFLHICIMQQMSVTTDLTLQGLFVNIMQMQVRNVGR